MSGRLLERGVRRYYLQRWPSQRAMKRVRGKIKANTGRGRAGQDIREVIAVLNPILRGWGNCSRTGNAAEKFNQIDSHVLSRLRGLMVKRYGRNLKAGQSSTWTREYFEAHGLYRLRGTVRYPGYASLTIRKVIGKPCAGRPHARIERGMRKRARQERAPRL